MANILGLSFFFHDSAAALVSDGQIIAAATEERFCRRKHTNEFPNQAIEYCLEQAGLDSVNDLDAIVFYEKPLIKFDRLLETFAQTWPRSLGTFSTRFPHYLKTKLNIYSAIENALPGYQGEILFSEHHLSHAASAFYCSPFEKAAILTIDGVGEWETTTIGLGEGSKISLLKSLRFPHSVGLFYSALTAYLGFKVNDAEWKVMGLAPYGKPTLVEPLRKLVSLKADGSFQLNLKYFSHHYSSTDGPNYDQWEAILGIPPRKPEEPLLPVHQDLARSGQVVVEDLILGLAREAARMTGSENLVIAGGVGLNSVANWRIEQEKIFDQVWIQPAAGDDGAALGAALVVSQQVLQEPRKAQLKDALLGPSFSDEQIKAFLDEKSIPYESLAPEVFTERVASLIASEKVIGWFQGRMEFGPRALGARSILASPCRAEMKEIINAKIKYREYFRPFAPAILYERVHEYFDVPEGTDLPFMLKIPQVRPEKRATIPAVTHEDGSGRVQTVKVQGNPQLYRLLQALDEKTGVPVVLNTSFNVRGEPIVCTPEDAYRCFIGTGIDALVLGSYLITEKPVADVDFQAGYAHSDQLERGEVTKERKVSLGSIEGAKKEKSIQENVLSFYKEMPFNFYSNSAEAAKQLQKKNRIREAYPLLHRHLKAIKNATVLDVGCGAGWFVNSAAINYPHSVTGLELNPVALKQAKGVARFCHPQKAPRFVQANLFEFKPETSFDVVNSLGVLHHTPDCHGAIEKALSWVAPNGYLHLGLYHSYGREPFLRHFRQLQLRGASEEELFKEFQALNPEMKDLTHLTSWFRDQVLHPHETQHSYEEIHGLLRKLGFTIEKTSINGFKKITSHEALYALEKTYAKASEVALYKKRRYFPGFFVVWAKRT